MKIQCPCGAKCEFEVTPEMAEGPVQFVCPACGADSSAAVTELVRQQLGVAPVARAQPLRVSLADTSAEAAPTRETEPASEAEPRRCPKHPWEVAFEACLVCGKRICPKCMELFGPVCGPLCRAKAEAQGVKVAGHSALRSAAEARTWRRAGQLATAGGVILAGLLVFWIWYVVSGSTPRVAFAVRFGDVAWSGASAFAPDDQIVFLHGGLLARYDMKSRKEIWSRQLVDEKQVDAAVQNDIQERQKAVEQARQSSSDTMVPPAVLRHRLEKEAAAALDLRVSGKNVWVSSPGKLVRYDWETGNPAKEIALPAGGVIAQGDELLLLGPDEGGETCVTRINLADGSSRMEALDGTALTNQVAAAQAKPRALAGLPVGMPGRDAGRAMDPAKVAEQAQHMSLPGRVALPAILSNNRYQERALKEMDDSPQSPAPAGGPALHGEALTLVPTTNGILRFSATLLARHIVAHSAMKPAPTKSVLDGNLSMSKTADAANEILNEMQRDRGGDVVEEDESRYQARLEVPGCKDGWTMEVIGPPSVVPLQSVNVVTANKTLVVLDKTNHKLWQATHSYNIPSTAGAEEGESGFYGQGPCVEHKGGLYVCDQGGLVAYDLATGARRWGLPSVGIAGIFFDDQNNLYVNTTTAGLDAIKYSRQIDISQKVRPVVFKIDSRTGKTLWTAHTPSLISYVSGKFVYCVQSYMPEDEEVLTRPLVQTGMETPAYLRITRINPKTGADMWEHFEQRAPVDVRFDNNRIRLVFKKEVQALKFLSF